jgi:hypothetical protein
MRRFSTRQYSDRSGNCLSFFSATDLMTNLGCVLLEAVKK